MYIFYCLILNLIKYDNETKFKDRVNISVASYRIKTDQ